MRLRNIPRAESVLANSEMVIKDERHFRGKWNSEIFHNNHPLHIEVGMGKGQFILTLAEQNPDITISVSNVIPASFYVLSRSWR